MRELPDKLDTAAVETRLGREWEEAGVYRYDATRPRDETFVVDTPPPTVSGSLHVGHVFSYTHTDLVARHWRMRGRNVFYPMGWDDNGLPTERRVQNHLRVRCEPHLPYDPQVEPDPKAKEATPVSRRRFIELCAQVTDEDEKAFRALWTRLGLSVDWSQTYTTVDEHCRRVSQLAFLDLVDKGEVYSSDAPTMWDVDFRTGVAQAEVEDREVQGFEFLLAFGRDGGGELPVMTTRPELLAACVGVVVHPDDDRYKDLVGRHAITPGFRVRVPVHAHELADPEKGTGAVMVCTFGDVTDVTWRDDLGLATRMVVGANGRILPVDWGSEGWESDDPEAAQALHEEIVGLTTKQAKAKVAGALGVEGTAVTQVVKFYEKGDRPLEFLPTRQWFIRLLDKKDALLAQGRKIAWHPAFMRTRYEHWVEGLRHDWNVSRQRYFGVPVPVWYRLDEAGEALHDSPIWPECDSLPVDPMTDVPGGYGEDQRDVPGGFTADVDVFDTWATSSLTPQIAAQWAVDDERFRRLFPMDVRPQSHEIIRTWAFYTIARAYMMDGSIPWHDVVISGWVLDPDRKKMSKSRGNVVTPMDLLERYGSDAARYWSASARLGTDTAYDESVFKVGRRLVTKLFNAAKLVVGRLRENGLGLHDCSPADVSHPLDRAHLALLGPVVAEATALFERFETAAALDVVETWFWSNLCDNFLELSKERAYEGDRSALAAWGVSLSTVVRLLAPFLPYVTDEIWGWEAAGSIHRAPWRLLDEVSVDGDPAVFEAAVDAITQIRKIKSEAKVSIKVPVPEARITGSPAQLAKLSPALGDVLSAGAIERVETSEGDVSALTVAFDLA